MKVRVDALNMPAFKATYLNYAETLQNREKNIRYLISPAFNTKLQTLNAMLNNFIDTAGQVPIEDQQELKGELKTLSTEAMSNLTTAGGAVLASAAKAKAAPAADVMEAYEKDFAAFSMAFNGLLRYNQYVAEIEKKIALPLPESINALADDIAATIQAVASAFGESILKDPMASVIAALPEQYWSQYKNDVNLSTNAGGINQQSLGDISKYVKRKPNRYNNTYARTFFGNSDIAIRMAAPGEFIVKGVRVDADEAIRNSFKVVAQGIKYIAYASNIPVPQAPNSPKPMVNPLLDSLAKYDTNLEATREQYSQATDAFLAVLNSAAADLNATRRRSGQTIAQIKEAALARVKTAYAVYKTALGE
jgi:hypothetical protein